MTKKNSFISKIFNKKLILFYNNSMNKSQKVNVITYIYIKNIYLKFLEDSNSTFFFNLLSKRFGEEKT